MNILIVAAGECLDYDMLLENAKESDYIICADGGYEHLEKIKVKPDLLVGDFDSLDKKPNVENIITLPTEKDETDTLFALKKAFKKEPQEIVIFGGIGTRFDHSYANVCLLSMCVEKNIKAVVTDGKTKIFMTDDKISFNNEKGKTISIYSFSEKCEGVTLEGFKYPLCDFTLKKDNILGTSNVIQKDEAFIKITLGKLLIICNENKNS